MILFAPGKTVFLFPEVLLSPSDISYGWQSRSLPVVSILTLAFQGPDALQEAPKQHTRPWRGATWCCSYCEVLCVVGSTTNTACGCLVCQMIVQFDQFIRGWKHIAPYLYRTAYITRKSTGTAKRPARPQNCNFATCIEGGDNWEYLWLPFALVKITQGQI